MRGAALFSPSWPGLSRPPTSLSQRRFKDVDARDKPGHDELDRLSQHHVCDTDQPDTQRKSGMTEFDPAEHRMVSEPRWFEDFVLGERFVIPSRTMTSAVFAAFQTASGDTHPVHYDVEYCRARGMPNLLAHGFQTLIHTAPGAGLFPYLVEESLVGFLNSRAGSKSRLCRRHHLSGARGDGARARPLYRRGHLAQHRVQPAPRAGAGGAAKISHSPTACPAVTGTDARPSHSITSSATASRFCGTSMPSSFAVLRLITSSNLIGCNTGISAGFAPFSIWPQ